MSADRPANTGTFTPDYEFYVAFEEYEEEQAKYAQHCLAEDVHKGFDWTRHNHARRRMLKAVERLCRSPAADRPVEDSEASPKAHDLIARYFQSVVAYHGEAHHDFEDTQARAVAMGERDGDLAEYITSLEAEVSRLKSPRPVENSELPELLETFQSASACYKEGYCAMCENRKRAAISGIKKLFGSLTAEISRLRADRLTPEEIRHEIDAAPDCPRINCPICMSGRAKLRRHLSSEGNPK